MQAGEDWGSRQLCSKEEWQEPATEVQELAVCSSWDAGGEGEMVEMQRLAHLDPVDLLDQECERLERFFEDLADAGKAEWSRETRCIGWGPREVLSHLAGADSYHLAGIEDRLNPLLEEAGKAGVTGIDSFNLWQVTSRADRSAGEVLDEWRGLNRAMRAGFRRLGSDGMVASMVGPYPARLQAFHVE